MQTFGSDRVRVAGEKVFLYSPISKGWTARVAKRGTHAEHPGTAVLWDEQYYEVVSAELAQGGGVRYVLLPWRDDHTIRVFDQYDAESEQRRIDDYRVAMTHRRRSPLVSLLGIVLGHLPAPVQNRLANEYGVAAPRMTLVSIIPSIVLLGICVWLYVDARMRFVGSPVPMWVWLLAITMLVDSAARFLVVMLQNRAQGSILGTIVYLILWSLAPQRFPSPTVERGRAIFMLTPDEATAQHDAIRMREPFFTLLTPVEQQRLAERFGFEYRRHATAPAVIVLICALMGVVSSWVKVSDTGNLAAWLSLLLAGWLTIEQIVRLYTFRRRPAGSILAVLVRPFMRDFLR